jgi:hypothetical protein
MREILVPPLRAAALGTFIAGLALLLLDPPSFTGLRFVLLLLVGSAAFVCLMAWLTVALIGDEMPEPDGDVLMRTSERTRSAKSSASSCANAPPAETPTR